LIFKKYGISPAPSAVNNNRATSSPLAVALAPPHQLKNAMVLESDEFLIQFMLQTIKKLSFGAKINL